MMTPLTQADCCQFENGTSVFAPVLHSGTSENTTQSLSTNGNGFFWTDCADWLIFPGNQQFFGFLRRRMTRWRSQVRALYRPLSVTQAGNPTCDDLPAVGSAAFNPKTRRVTPRRS
jgi:hypothetical protein